MRVLHTALGRRDCGNKNRDQCGTEHARVCMQINKHKPGPDEHSKWLECRLSRKRILNREHLANTAISENQLRQVRVEDHRQDDG